ncbi:MAG: SIMPL domain-containing protein [Herpetosiphon sp.]
MQRVAGFMAGSGLVMALGVGFLGGQLSLLRPSGTAAAAATTETRRTITVIGEGTIRAEPNTATVQVGVRSQGTTAKIALADNSDKMAVLMSKLKEAGVAPKDVQTNNFHVGATYDGSNHQINGYEVNNSVKVVVHDITKTGDLLDKVVQAGANNVMGISFGFDDVTGVRGRARTAAMDDASTKAQGLVLAAGASLGKVITISESGNGAPPMPMLQAGAASAAVPIAPGEQSIVVNVQVTFELQ